jgi:peptide/nickel transport system ATP-binding protein
MTDANVVLDVDDLSVGFPTADGVIRAVRGVSYELRRGEVLGIVGESGSGKSVAALALMGLLPRNAEISGSAMVVGQEMIGAGDIDLSAVRGNRIAMVFQDPLTSLTPVYTVGRQLTEAVLAHHKLSARQAEHRAVELLEIVGIPHPEQRIHAYPHELSGGMRQRVVIAIAMANGPDVIIADEPTTALDVTVQAQVLEALETARIESGAAMVLITHDLGIVAGHADRVAVMYAGKIIEYGSADEVFYAPRMPYTVGLLGSLPRLGESGGVRLTPIRGTPPSLLNLPPGCPFEARCPMAEDICRVTEPELRLVRGAHAAACHFSERLVDVTPAELFGQVATARDHRPPARDSILSARHMVKHFPVRSKGVLKRKVGEMHAVCDVSLDLYAHETLGLVGESGCGKSTIARLLLNLIPATSGVVRVRGKDLQSLSRNQTRSLRRDIQVVFQDPFASLDPRMTAFGLIAEPLRIHGRYNVTGKEQVRDLLRLVGLNPEHGNRYPHEFSGGERQRISIARALALRPSVLILDEPVSALDVSIRADVINLLEDLQEELELSCLFVSHDLSVVQHIADRLAVMYLGRIVEIGTTDCLFSSATHPYTQALISAIPLPDPRKERERQRIVLTGEVPSPADPPSGCRFRTRCPKFAAELSATERHLCVEQVPQLMDRGPGHASACHYAEARKLI